MTITKLMLVAALWVPSTYSLAAPITPTDCLSYWQLRSVGLSREYGVASATLSNRYHQQYKSTLLALKAQTDPQTLVAQTYQSMALIMSKIDNDYERTAELDEDYQGSCPLADEF